MTLGTWGPQNDQPPLVMGIRTGRDDTPFSVAFLRGHYGVARAILAIIKAQWSPPEKENVRYRMEADEEDDDEYRTEGDEDSDDEDEPRIVSEKVDQEFTIDNIGQVSMQTKSHFKPLDVICGRWSTMKLEDDELVDRGTRSLFIHVMEEDHVAGLKFLLDVAQEHSNEKVDGDDDSDENTPSGRFSFPDDAFTWAIENGKVDMLGVVIKRTGAGIPLDHLVKKSGVEVKKKPRYYQGLTVYGKKRYVPWLSKFYEYS